MSVLVVEDNPISAKAMQATLTKHGFETAIAYTGAQALEYLEGNPQVEVAVVDLILPEMDGFQLIRRMKQSELLKYVPVVVCTTLRDVEAVQRSARLGCRYYLVKPVVAEELVKKIYDAMDHGMVLMESRRRTMERLDLDHDAYEEIIRAFGKLLDEKLGQVYALMEGRLPRDVKVDLTDLAEGGQLLGAQKLLVVLDRFNLRGERGKPEPSRQDYEALLRELSALERLLRPARRIRVTI